MLTGCSGLMEMTTREMAGRNPSKAEELIDEQQDQLREAKELFNNAPNLLATIKKTVDEAADLKKQVEQFAQERVGAVANELAGKTQDINGVKVITYKADISTDVVRGIASQLRGRFADEKFLLVIGAVADGKPSLTIALSQPLIDTGLNATNMVREAAKEIDGNGGGQPFMATAGGKNAGGLDKAIAKVLEMLK